jgi:multidrug efflux pump subunit AcrA (membrane-fusion protein)
VAKAKADYAQSQASLAEAVAQLGAEGDDNATFRAALAALHQAQLDLEFTTVRAPVSGHVTNLNLRLGSQAVANQAMLALAEVENASVAYLKSQEQLRDFQQAADAAQRAADISSEQYLDGMVDYNTVITTLRTLASQQDQLASIQGTVTANLVDIYKSLGGGWQVHESRDPLELLPASTRQEMLDRTKAWRKVFK